MITKHLLTLLCASLLLTPNFALVAYAQQPPPLPPPPSAEPLPPPTHLPSQAKGTDPALPSEKIEVSELKGDEKDGPNIDQVQTSEIAPERLKELAAMLPAFKRVDDGKFELIRFINEAPPRATTDLMLFPPKKIDAKAPAIEENQSKQPLYVLRTNKVKSVSQPSPKELTVVFNQPMVTIGDTTFADTHTPVKLTPQPKGKWHWVNPTTIQFLPSAKCLPNATSYKIEVPSGTTAASGGKMERTYSANFATPAPSVVSFGNFASKLSQREDGEYLSPLLFFEFNQSIDSENAIKKVVAKVGKLAYVLRAPTQAELKQYSGSGRLLDGSTKQRYLVLKPVVPFPKSSTVSITVSPGVASLEGPLTGANAQNFSYSPCNPMTASGDRLVHFFKDSPYIRFSNNVARRCRNESFYTVTPKVSNLKLSFSKQTVKFDGDFNYGVNYRIQVSKDLEDVYGQRVSGQTSFIAKQDFYPAQLRISQSAVVALVPEKKALFHLYTFNEPDLKVSVYEAESSDWQKFQSLRTKIWEKKIPAERLLASYTKVFQQQFVTPLPLDDWHDTSIDVNSFAKGKSNHYIVVADVPTWDKKHRTQQLAWIEYSPIRALMDIDQKSAFALVSNAMTGMPLSNARVKFLPSNVGSITDANGLCKISMPDKTQVAVQCDYGKETTILYKEDGYGFERLNKKNTELVVYGVTDRGLYKPGESAHIAGILRIRNYLNDERLEIPQQSFTWKVATGIGPNVEALARGTLKPDKFGTFAFDFDIPKNTALGYLYVTIGDSSDLVTSVKVQEFRQPEFQGDLNADNSATTLGDPVALHMNAKYRSGGALSFSPVNWNVRSEPSSFSPPTKWSDWSFSSSPSFTDDAPHNYNDATVTLTGQTDNKGGNGIIASVSKLAEIQPVKLTVTATVEDLNRQSWNEHCDVLVHPSDVYVGMKNVGDFSADQSTPIQWVVIDHDGGIVADRPVHLSLSRIVSNSDADDDDNFKRVRVKVLELDVQSTSKLTEQSFGSLPLGNYTVNAMVVDKQGRKSQSNIDFNLLPADIVAKHVAAEAEASKQSEGLELIADKENYNLGDTAQVTIKSPVPNGHGVLLIKREATLQAVPIVIKNNLAKASIKMTELFIPNCFLDAIIVAPNAKLCQGSKTLSVKSDPMNLELVAESDKVKYQPGTSVHVKFKLQDSKGEAVSDGKIVLTVVDESLLSLTKFAWTNPLDTIFGTPSHYESDLFSLPIINFDPGKPSRDDGFNQAYPGAAPPPPPRAMRPELSALPEPSALPPPPLPSGGTVYGQSNGDEPEVKVRSDFRPLAYFNSDVITDKDGVASVDFTLPENLTSYKIMAIAVKDTDHFGSGESTFKASLPVQVRPSLPRFLNYKDKCDLPFIVQNNDDKPVSCELVVRANNASVDSNSSSMKTESNETGSASSRSAATYLTGRRFTVPANGRVQIQVRLSADFAGKQIDVQSAAISSLSNDASLISIPLNQPITSESFAAYGQIADGVEAQRISLPANALPNVGGLSITTSSTAMTETVDAADYLLDYPFECSEQLSARILGLTGVTDLSAKFSPMSDKQLSVYMKAQEHAVAEIIKRQQANGGFGLWKIYEKELFPYVSVQCVRALYEASKHGVAVPPEVLAKGKAYLGDIALYLRREYTPTERISLQAFALNTLYQMGDIRSAQALKVIKDAGAAKSAVSSEALGWLLPVVAANSKSKSEAETETKLIIIELQSRISETASTASFEDDVYSRNAYLLFYSPSRMNSVILDALLVAKPSSDLVSKLMKGLLQQRAHGRWQTTQENAFALLALSKYFSKFEKESPDFNARFWLGGALSFEQKFVGRSIKECELKVPMEFLSEHANDNLLTIAKKGPGRLYYRVGMNYAPAKYKLPADSRGFSVLRIFEPVDHKSDVFRDSNGVWQVKAGATVRVRVKFNAAGMRYHVALTDPLAAGCEIVNTALEGARRDVDANSMPADGDDSDKSNDQQSTSMPFEPSFSWTWYDQQNFRDNRAEVFTTLLYSGDYEYTYLIHATTTGSFIVPPTKVEEMYAPETFGRTATDIMVIK